jgi:hypothetical protein
MSKFYSLFYEDGHGMEKIAILMELGGLDLSRYARLMMGNADTDESKFLFIVKQMLLGLNEVHSAGQSSKRTHGRLNKLSLGCWDFDHP